MEINQIIRKIDGHHLFVPAFQREYVWKREDAKKLVDSLIKGYPTGIMLTWETNNPPELKGKYAYEASKVAVKLILDGQQRITTLYMLITGEIPPYYTKEEVYNDIRGLYVNVESLSLEYYKKSSMQNDPNWVSITEIFKGEVRKRDIIDALEEKNKGERLQRELENKIDDNIESIKRIRERDFLEQVIPINATIKEAIDIFYMVNSSGVNLTDAELALAQISGYWPKAREEIKTKLDDLKSKGWVFDLNLIVYTFLAILYKQGSKMEKLHNQNNKEKIKEVWKKLEGDVLDYTFNLLQSYAYIDHSDEINSIYALIPIIAYVHSKPGCKLNEDEIKKLVKWFYYSQIRSRYAVQLRQKLDKDLKIVNDSPSPFEELLKIIEAEEGGLEIKASEFVGSSTRHPLFGLMRWYFKSQGAVCLGTGMRLRKNMGKKYQLEKDHIFAFSVLRDSDCYDMNDRFDYALAQEMTNQAILTLKENRAKSAKFAEAYLSQVKKRFPNALRLQCIPENEELWKIENYKDFLQARRELLTEKLNDFLNNIASTNKDVIIEIDLKELIESGEDECLEFKSAMRWNLREGQKDKKMEEIILKSIAAFSNSEGGKLLIGVGDSGDILGLQDDYNTLQEANKDHFELHLRNMVNNAYGNVFSASQMKVDFPAVEEIEICRIDIKAGVKPLFLEVFDKNGQKRKKFFVRSGNSSCELDIQATAEYIEQRFENSK